MNSVTVIVGGSVGGVRTAQALRSQGYAGNVVVLEAESHPPYDKPPLSKGFLDASVGADRLQLISGQEMEELKIDFRPGHRAVELDVSKQEVLLSDGDRLEYDNLIVATGARARPSPWGMPRGVHVLRSLNDAIALRQDLEKSGSMVVVGGGFIGAEVAATGRKLGLDVTIVDPLEIPMGRVLGDWVGEKLTGLHHLNQVSTLFGVGVESISRSNGHLVVGLSNGRMLSSDVIVVGIGAIPNVEWLESSGLVLDNGLVCDEFCRAVGQPNIYGVGDIARWYHPQLRRLVRVEHWTNAVEQAVCVANNVVAGSELTSYSPVPYVWSDQYDWKIQIAGETAGIVDYAQVVDPSRQDRFAAVYSDSNGDYCGVATVNWPRAMIQCRRLLGDESDPSVPISLLRQMV